MKENKNVQQINIELSQEVSEGEYSNFVVVTHSPAEFVMDFIRVLPGMTKSKVKSRIIMAPMHAKTLMIALQDNINKFENKFGEIKIAKGKVPTPEIKLPDDDNIYKPVKNLFILSQCNHFIVTTSTFNWWGAWLCPKKNKIICNLNETSI